MVKGKDGRTLRQRLVHELERHRKAGTTMVWGGKFHQEMRDTYKQVPKAIVELCKPGENGECEIPTPALLKAM